jgi:hypothetical protein
MRFTGVNVPRRATITKAYIQFQVDETSSGPTALTIGGQAIGNAPTFRAVNGDISSRMTTDAAVDWSPAPWSTGGAAGVDQRTPDIHMVVQEIVRGNDWGAGNALVILVAGASPSKANSRVAESYDGVAVAAPVLHLEYLP